jgi:hypothetical protein
MPARRRHSPDDAGRITQLRRNTLRVPAVLDEDVQRFHNSRADACVGEHLSAHDRVRPDERGGVEPPAPQAVASRSVPNRIPSRRPTSVSIVRSPASRDQYAEPAILALASSA